MDIKEFINEYKEANNKEAFIKKHIVVDYVPYSEKIDTCNNILFQTTHRKKDDTDKLIYIPCTPLSNLFFTLTLIRQYTDIEFELGFDAYDLLDSNRLINGIISLINQDELITYKTLNDMCKSDEYEKERSLISYIDNKIDEMYKNIMFLSESLKEEKNE